MRSAVKEAARANGIIAKPRNTSGRVLAQKRLPAMLALAAIVLMLPALSAGLFLDDLVQRLSQFTPAELPPEIPDTGFAGDDSGTLRTVLTDLFGFPRGKEAMQRAIDYGLIPWWARDGLQAALWRPFTAFTHWVDYRLYPNTPALMHAHSISWFALAVYLAATLYRRFQLQFGPAEATSPVRDACRFGSVTHVAIASLAGLLFLLDQNAYFPVMFVANRGFIISLAFGLLCTHLHHRWRTTGSRAGMVMSGVSLLLALLANEGGASTLAFLIGYALVLERGGWIVKTRSLAPAIVVVAGWRLIYVSSGFGVRNLGGYIDPGYEPVAFLQALPFRIVTLLGGQLTGISPEVTVVLNSEWRAALVGFFAGFLLFSALACIPVVRRDRVARFWAVSMLLAAIPAATVYPLSKNLAFVAVGAFGMMAAFLGRFASGEQRLELWGRWKWLAGAVAVWLLVAHTAGALVGRAMIIGVQPFIPRIMARWSGFENVPQIGGKDVVIINSPSQLTSIAAPFYRAYHGLPLPRSMHTLVPGSVAFEIHRPTEHTLRLQAAEGDLFGAPKAGPVHICYLFDFANRLIGGSRAWKVGEVVQRRAFVVQVERVSQNGRPTAVSIQFNRTLESDEVVWLFFDWSARRYLPLALPRTGDIVRIPGVR